MIFAFFTYLIASLYFLLPLLVFVALACLPRGRVAATGIAAFALALVYFSFVPDRLGTFAGYVPLAAGGVAMAVLAQTVRLIPSPAGRWRYPMLVATIGLVGSASIVVMI